MDLASAGRGPLYLSLRSKTSFWLAAPLSVILYGPLPTGFMSNFLASASTTALGTILTTLRRSATREKAYLSLMVTVPASLASTLSMKGRNCEYSDLLAGSSTRVKEKTTSSAVTAEPSENFASLRNATS